MLGASLRYGGGKEFLALPGGLDGYRSGHTTGLPLLAPWANRLGSRRYHAAGVTVDLGGVDMFTDPGGLPIHGTMHAHSGWEIVELKRGAGAASLRSRFDYGSWPELLRRFPFPHEITLEARLTARELSVTTRVRSTGSGPVPISFGFHPYFRLPEGGRPDWRLRLPGRRHLQLDARGLPSGAAEAMKPEDDQIGKRTFDDLYELGSDRRLGISAGAHRLVVTLGKGYPFAQVFAPPGQRFVCLEPMTASTNALMSGRCPVVAVGEVFTARFSVSVEVGVDARL